MSKSSDALKTRRFKILADENRLKILEYLYKKPSNVSTIASSLNIEQSLLSHHLKIMKDEGLLEGCRDGKTIVYRIAQGIEGGKSKKILNMKCCKIELG